MKRLFANGKAKPRVKICGITSWADAKLALEGGADALGFNFYRSSPRYVAPGKAAGILRRVRAAGWRNKVTIVGVFVDETPAAIRQIADAVGLDAVQLHGQETPRQAAETARFRPVIKAFRVRPGFRLEHLKRYPSSSAFLLDGFRPGFHGGTGRRFDWSVARKAAGYGRILLAGGLQAENVGEAIARARPFALDVCSGVEARPGKKDPGKVKKLMAQVRKARRKRR